MNIAPNVLALIGTRRWCAINRLAQGCAAEWSPSSSTRTRRTA